MIKKTIEGRLQSGAIVNQIQEEANLQNIAFEASENISEDDETTPPDEDFMGFFKSKARHVSDEEMQKLWGRILSDEMKQKGSYSKRTVEFVTTLSRDEIEAIEKFYYGVLILPSGLFEVFQSCKLSEKIPENLKQEAKENLPNVHQDFLVSQLGLISLERAPQLSVEQLDSQKDGRSVIQILENHALSISVKDIENAQETSRPKLKNPFKDNLRLSRGAITKLGHEIGRLAYKERSAEFNNFLLKSWIDWLKKEGEKRFEIQIVENPINPK